MPDVLGYDDFSHGDFTVPGGGPYDYTGGTPTKGTTNLRTGDPASMDLASGSDFVAHKGSLTALAWRAFAWRLDAADEPGSNQLIAQFWATGFASAAKLYWVVGADELSHSVDDAGFSNIATPLDEWNWIEQIFDVSTSTFTIHTRVNGTDMTNQTNTGVATTVQYDELGRAGMTHRFSHSMWGTAASTDDWMGEPFNRPLRVTRGTARW